MIPGLGAAETPRRYGTGAGNGVVALGSYKTATFGAG